MSTEFVQFNFPCADCLVRAACKEKPTDEAVIQLYDKYSPRCLAIPKLPSEITYIKGLLECWANLGTRIVNNMQKSEDPQTCSETKSNIPMQYVMLMGRMCYLLQWMTNSVSWTEGVLQDFDRIEVNLKCKGISL